MSNQLAVEDARGHAPVARRSRRTGTGRAPAAGPPARRAARLPSASTTRICMPGPRVAVVLDDLLLGVARDAEGDQRVLALAPAAEHGQAGQLRPAPRARWPAGSARPCSRTAAATRGRASPRRRVQGVVQERRRRRGVGDAGAPRPARRTARGPRRPGRPRCAADLHRQPGAVEEAGEVRERRRHVDHAVAGRSPSRSGSGVVRRHQRVVGVHHALGLTGGARGEDQQGDVVRVGAQARPARRGRAAAPTGWP